MFLIGSNSPAVIFHSQPVLTLEDVGNIMPYQFNKLLPNIKLKPCFQLAAQKT